MLALLSKQSFSAKDITRWAVFFVFLSHSTVAVKPIAEIVGNGAHAEDAVAKEVICNDIAALDAEHKNELLQFILPRLQFIVDKESLCPDDCGGPNHGQWLNMIKAMNEELKDGNMNLFLKNMWLLYSCDWSLLDEEDLEYYCSVYDEEIKG